ncbi:hypothetical protein LINPERHAP2_LOCUS24332 [Linum perenne]
MQVKEQENRASLKTAQSESKLESIFPEEEGCDSWILKIVCRISDSWKFDSDSWKIDD